MERNDVFLFLLFCLCLWEEIEVLFCSHLALWEHRLPHVKKQHPLTQRGNFLVWGKSFLYGLVILLLIIISIFDYGNVLGLILMSGKPLNGYFVRLLLVSMHCSGSPLLSCWWMKEVCFFFLFVPFLCMNQGWQNALWVKLGWQEGFWGNNMEFSSHKSPLSTVTCNPTAPASHTAVLTSEHLTEARSEFH